MFGFIIGTVCLIGLIATIRAGRWQRFHGYGGGWGHHHGHGHGHARGCGGGGWGRHEHGDFEGAREDFGRRGGGGGGGGGGFGFNRGKRFILRSVFERLDTTPGQEKVIMSAVDEMQEAIGKAKDGWKSSRGDVAKAVRSESFDAVHLGEVFVKHDDAIDHVRKAFVGAMGKVHEALDERQRKILADMVEAGPRGFFGGGWGAYRGGY